jgi:hypothetical protein
MQFKPKSEEEVRRIFSKGSYAFKVIDAIEKNSSKGNPMIELNLEIYHNIITGKTNLVRCFLMTSEPNFEFLIRHFCYSIGMIEAYESGNLIASTLVGKIGTAVIGIEVDKDGKYPDKNRVLDFIEKSPTQIGQNVLKTVSQSLPSDPSKTFNDDIPF